MIGRGGQQAGDLVDLRGAGGAKDQRDAVEQKSCGKGAEQKVLDGGFGAAARVLAIAGQNVGGDGGDLQRDEDQQQLDRAGEQAHADRAKDDQRVELALMMAVFRQGVEREQQSHQHDAANQHVEEDGKGAGFDGAVEAGSHGQGKLPQAGPQGEGGSDGRNPAQRAACPMGRQRGVDHHDGDAGQREDHLGKDTVDVGNGIHRWASPGSEIVDTD